MIVVKLLGARQRTKVKNGRCEGRKPYGFYPGEVETLNRIGGIERIWRVGNRHCK